MELKGIQQSVAFHPSQILEIELIGSDSPDRFPLEYPVATPQLGRSCSGPELWCKDFNCFLASFLHLCKGNNQL